MTDRAGTSLISETSDAIRIIYDGECPFCSAYVRLLRLREAAGPVDLVDARAHPDLARDFLHNGIDLNQTMVVRCGGQTYAGAEAVEMLSLLSSGSGLMNRLFAGVLRDRRRAGLLYPVLRAGRNLTLRMLGRPRLEVGE